MTHLPLHLLVLLGICLAGAVLSAPQGFLLEDGRPRGFDHLEQINNIASIRALAEDGDYILLQGHFVARKDENTYIFADLTGETIAVNLGAAAEPPVLEAGYLIFAVVRTTLCSRYLDLRNLSAPRS